MLPPDALWQEALAEALRRDPTLAESTDAATLARLATAIPPIQEEMRLIAGINAAKHAEAEELRRIEQEAADVERARLENLARQKEQEEARLRIEQEQEEARLRTEQEREGARIRAERDIEVARVRSVEMQEQARLRLEATARALEEEDRNAAAATADTQRRIAAMNPMKRWVVRHKRASRAALALVIIALVIGGVTYGVTRANEESQRYAAALAVLGEAVDTASVAVTASPAPAASSQPAQASAVAEAAAVQASADAEAAAVQASADAEAAAVAWAALAKACAAGDCKVGGPGPGGGIVFYDAGATKAWGRYLEAAPVGWNGGADDPEVVWCDPWDVPIPRTRGNAIGTGEANTRAMLAECSSGAAVTAHEYAGGGKKDWFLPSRDELARLFMNLQSDGGFVDDVYWSSSPEYETSEWAWSVFSPVAAEDLHPKDYPYRVRPVRAF